jgi:hypothetical protein
MAQTTTDDAPAIEPGADEALPVTQDDQTAATEPAEPTSTQAEGEDAAPAEDSVPKADDKLNAWAESKGITLDSEGAIKAAKIAMDNQAEYQRTRQQASELEKSLKQDMSNAVAAGDDDLVASLAQEVQGLKLTQSVNTYLSTGTSEEVAEKKALEPVMGQIVTDNPDIGTMVKQGFLSLDQLAAMARGSDRGREAQLKADGGREALQKVADRTSAKAVVGSATTSDLTGNEQVDPFDAGFNSSS